MNYNRNVALVFTLLLFLTNCHKVMAISNQAQSVIENIRNSLKSSQSKIIESNVVKSIEINEFKGYIPGNELEIALKKMRSSLYDLPQQKINNNSQSKHVIKSQKTNVLTNNKENKPYIPGEALSRKLAKVRNIISNGKKSNVKAKRQIPNLINLKKSLLIDHTENTDEIHSFIEDNQKASFANKTKQYDELKDLNKVKKLELKLSNKRKLEIKKKNLQKKINNKLSNKEVNSFNTGIKFHEFKMPRNYRIIVR